VIHAFVRYLAVAHKLAPSGANWLHALNTTSNFCAAARLLKTPAKEIRAIDCNPCAEMERALSDNVTMFDVALTPNVYK
jgi:hypothetical protein